LSPVPSHNAFIEQALPFLQNQSTTLFYAVISLDNHHAFRFDHRPRCPGFCGCRPVEEKRCDEPLSPQYVLLFFVLFSGLFRLLCLLSYLHPVGTDCYNPIIFPHTEFADVLEQLEATFYSQALAKFKESDFTAAGFPSAQLAIEQFLSIRDDEVIHATVLEVRRWILVQSPLFQF
jgi:hypothetical protein